MELNNHTKFVTNRIILTYLNETNPFSGTDRPKQKVSFKKKFEKKKRISAKKAYYTLDTHN